MKTLIIFRHAKSSWALPGVDDSERPLNDRGRTDAPRMGEWLSAMNVVPQKILSSSAVRTRQTLELLLPTFADTPDVEIKDDLYLANSAKVIECAGMLEDDVDTALILAHNPGLHEAALSLLTKDEQAQSDTLRVHFPTAGCAIITLPVDRWSLIQKEIGTLTSYMLPKALGSAIAS